MKYLASKVLYRVLRRSKSWSGVQLLAIILNLYISNVTSVWAIIRISTRQSPWSRQWRSRTSRRCSWSSSDYPRQFWWETRLNISVRGTTVKLSEHTSPWTNLILNNLPRQVTVDSNGLIFNPCFLIGPNLKSGSVIGWNFLQNYLNWLDTCS